MRAPAILCVTGESGSGKTTLLEALLGALTASGLRVAAIKHAACGPAAGAAGKDSRRLAAAGARPAVAAGPGGLVVEGPSEEMSPAEVAAGLCGGCDLVLAEGYKHSPHEKLRVGPDGVSAADGTGFAPQDHDAVAAWVRRWLQRRRKRGEGVIGAILAGGRSRRMGFDKASLRVDGRGVLARLAETLAGRVEEVWVIGRAPGGGPPGWVRRRLDRRPDCGPLGGIETALHAAAGGGHAAALVVACDMPRLGPEAVDLLLVGRDRTAAATALRLPGTEAAEPLAAVYEVAALEPLRRALDEGRLSATAFLARVEAAAVEVPPDMAGQLANVNTPEDLEGLQAGG